mmetsp:Transcript_8269/g.19448  ORF Transcript_8269/g.19448 Transcript_8269/m.19448 type:complete len:419 (+) Transcript_8269:627-1883(+)
MHRPSGRFLHYQTLPSALIRPLRDDVRFRRWVTLVGCNHAASATPQEDCAPVLDLAALLCNHSEVASFWVLRLLPSSGSTPLERHAKEFPSMGHEANHITVTNGCLACNLPCRANCELLPLASVSISSLHTLTFDIQIAAVESAQVDGIAIVDAWVGSRVVQHLLEKIVQLRRCCRGWLAKAQLLSSLQWLGPAPSLSALLPIPVGSATGVRPSPEEPSVGSLSVCYQLRFCKKPSHLFPAEKSWLGTSAQSQTPLTHNDWISSQFASMLLHCAQMLSESSTMPFILKAVVPMHLETNVALVELSPLRRAAPLLDEVGQGALKDWQHHSYSVSIHASIPHSADATCVEVAQCAHGNILGWFIAKCNSSDSRARRISSGNNIQSLQRFVKTPLSPMPFLRRPLAMTTRCLRTFTAWCTM